MPEPLALERFEAFEKTMIKRFDDQDELLTAAKETVDTVAADVAEIKGLLWQGHGASTKPSGASSNLRKPSAALTWLFRLANPLASRFRVL